MSPFIVLIVVLLATLSVVAQALTSLLVTTLAASLELVLL